MATIITEDDLPTSVQGAELIELMIDAANAKASRVAPCLTAPTTAWAATTAYAVNDKVVVSGGAALRVTVAGTSGASSPMAPDLDGTVTDGTVTWVRIGPTADLLAEAKLILAGAIQRWNEAGAGAISTKTETLGPYMTTETLDTKRRTGFNFWPSEITALQDLCKSGGTNAVFSIDTAPSLCGEHHPWCSLSFGATYCSCGADIAGYPIFETG